MKNELRNNKILLVEDEFYISDLYKMILESAGFEVILAVNGEEGLKYVEEEQPNLILLDIMLPKINGIEVLKKLKKTKIIRDIPVLLLTNLGRETIIKMAFGEGAAGYFLKARLKPEDLIQTVNYFLEHPDSKMDVGNLTFD